MSAEEPTAKPKPPPSPLAKIETQSLNAKELLFRVVIVVVILCSLALAWWSIERLVPRQKQSRELTLSVNRLSDAVNDQARKWTQSDAELIRGQFRQVRSQLFADEMALQTWLANLQEQAARLDLDVKVDFGKTTTMATNNEELAIILTTVALEVRPAAGGSESPYQRLLRLSRQLAVDGKRADLAEVTVTGGPNSITRADLVFTLWAGSTGTEEGRAEQGFK